MPFAKALPEWNVVGTKPPLSKMNTGWAANEKPPADWFNWIWNTTYQAMKEMQENAIHKDRIGVTVASLVNGKVPASQLDVQAPADASTTVKGIVMLEDSVTSSSVTKAATAKSVKQAYDLAASRSNFSGNYNDLTNKPTIPTNAAQLSITDSGDYYTSTNTEGALQEIGQMLNAVRGSLITSANNLLGS